MREYRSPDYYNWGNKNVLNYTFVGINDYLKMKVEFEMVDLFLFFSLSGVIVYYYFIKDYFCQNHMLGLKLLFIVIFL